MENNNNKGKCTITNDDQRIILATLSTIVFDLLSVRVKDKKIEESSSANQRQIQESDHVVYNESTINIYQYSGFAIHSMMEARKKSHSKGNKSEVLEAMKCKKDELDRVPNQIHELNQGNLCVVSPEMITSAKALLHKIMLNINNDKLKVHGHKIIEIARPIIVDDVDLSSLF